MQTVSVTKEFPGGNIRVISATQTEIHLKNELRDTQDDWFYWAFRVDGAAGKTVAFVFDENARVGPFGAAVSADFYNWRWTGGAQGQRFVYTFGPNEDRLYFAHHMLYRPERFFDFAKKHGLVLDTLCLSRKGREVPYTVFGSGSRSMILTARHHACESTGNAVLEGVLESLTAHPLSDMTVFCVPFVDYDGVIDGDQGKNRRPHDHNRDYIAESIYPEVRAIKDYAAAHAPTFAFDFHSPWHCGGQNDFDYIVQNNSRMVPRYQCFSKLLAEKITSAAFRFDGTHDFPPDTQWNSSKSPTFGVFMASQPSCALAFSLETPYFGTPDNVYSIDAAVETGRCFAAALRDYAAKIC